MAGVLGENGREGLSEPGNTVHCVSCAAIVLEQLSLKFLLTSSSIASPTMTTTELTTSSESRTVSSALWKVWQKEKN